MVQNPIQAESGVQVAVSGDASEFNGAMDSATSSLVGFNKKAAGVAAGGLAVLSGALAGKSVSAAADFESALADLQKVTNEQTADELADDIQGLAEEIPLSTEALAGLATQAGRFGVEGTENIREFTRIAAEMGSATALSADEAGKALAKVSEATGTPIENIQQLGDSINELSNNFATNSQEIVDSAQRAGFGLQDLGLRSDDILALSASMNEVAPTSRRAAMMLRQISEALRNPENAEAFAEVLGLSVEQFETMVEENPQETIIELSEAMAQNEDAANDLTQELSTAQARAFQRVTGRSEDLADAMETSNAAMEEGGSLSREVAIETSTLSGQMGLLRSKVNNVFIEIGERLLPVALDLVDGFERLIGAGTDIANNVLPDLDDAFNTGVSSLTGFINDNEGLQSALGESENAMSELKDSVLDLAGGDVQGAFDGLGDAADNATDAVRDALVGTDGEGGLVAEVSAGVEDAQQYLRNDGADALRSGMLNAGESLADGAKDFRTILIGPDGNSGALSEMVDAGIEFISDTAPTLFGDAMQAIGTGIRRGLQDLTNPLRGEDSEIMDIFADGVTWATNNVPDMFVAVGEAVVDGIIEGFQGLVQGLVGSEDGEITAAFNDAVDQLINGGLGMFSSLGGAVAESIGDGLASVGNIISELPDLSDVGALIVDSITSGIDIASDIADGIVDGLDGLKNGIQETWNDTIGGSDIIPPFEITGIPKTPFNGIDFSGVEVPQLAEGGVVTDETLALIGEGGNDEAVVPLEDDSRVGGGATTINADITVHAQDGSDAGRQIRRELEAFDI